MLRSWRPVVLLATRLQCRMEVAMDSPDIAVTSTVKPTRKTSSFEREGWWRTALKNTPVPGTYHVRNFIEESLLNPVVASYNFKNEGRRKPPLVQRSDPVLTDLPLYMPPDFLDLLKKQVATYSFKDQPRSSPSTLVYKDQKTLPFGDYPYLSVDIIPIYHGEDIPKISCGNEHCGTRKSVKLSPGQYDVLPAPVPKYASRSFVFRSTVQRFPTACFTPREGPGPGHYNLNIPLATSVTSCFQSRVPRFLPACSKTPGPGAYTPSAQFPKQSRTIAKMGREHSLFFNNTIGF